MGSQIADLAEMLMTANYVIAFTGAGISTESGIPDFRSRNGGLWTRISPELLSAATLRADPELFYRHFRVMEQYLEDKEPNQGHRALADLSRLGILRGIVTQNIDGLHQKSGSRRVLEVHGNRRLCRCLACKAEYPYQLLGEQLAKGAAVPVSPCCTAVLRPNIVLFGDRMADDFTLARQEAFRSDLAVAVGTSLTVFPAAEIPLSAGRLVIINSEKTEFDHQAAMVVQGPAGPVLVRLVEKIRAKRQAKA